jgi:hypothetical protein
VHVSHGSPNQIECAKKASSTRLTKIDRVLYLPGATLSQTLVGLAPGTTYTLQYYYQIHFTYEGEGDGSEVLTTTIGGQVVDINLVHYGPPMSGYASRSAAYIATADSATLLFTLTGSYVGEFALDAITLTSA